MSGQFPIAVSGQFRHSVRARATGDALAYSLKARMLRRCCATRADGEPCQAWAIWRHPDGLCAAHAGVTGGPRRQADGRPTSSTTRATPSAAARRTTFRTAPVAGGANGPIRPRRRESMRPSASETRPHAMAAEGRMIGKHCRLRASRLPPSRPSGDGCPPAARRRELVDVAGVTRP